MAVTKLLLLIWSVWYSLVAEAYRASEHDVFQSSETALDLSGAWVRKRGVFRRDRHYDVARDGADSYEGFPITACYEGGGNPGGMLTQMKCDSTVSLAVVDTTRTENGKKIYRVDKRKVFRHDARTTRISGCGNERVNGEYMVVGYHNNRPEYARLGDDAVIIHWSVKRGVWRLIIDETWFGHFRKTLYESPINEELLPTEGWRVNGGASPAPSITVEANQNPNFARSRFVVSGSGDARVNGEFQFVGLHNGRPAYKMVVGRTEAIIHWSKKLDGWRLFVNNFWRFRRTTLYLSRVESFLMPTTGWEAVHGTAPVPTFTASRVLGEDPTGGILTDRVFAIVKGEDVSEITWSDGAVWRRYTGADQYVDKWDQECRKLHGAGGQRATAVGYAPSFVASVFAGYTNVPGFNMEVVQCVSSEWLGANDQHFRCVLDKATGNSSLAQATVVKALLKIRSMMPRSESATCIPSICLGLGWPVFPIPSPVPSVYVFGSWPMRLKSCNGISLNEEIDRAILEGPNVPKKPEKDPIFVGGHMRHGVSMLLFPVPAVSYMIAGVQPISLSRFFKGTRGKVHKPNLNQMRTDTSNAIQELDAAIRTSMESCPDIRRRFDLHRQAPHVIRMIREEHANAHEELRLVLGSFPELAGKGTIKPSIKRNPGFAVGGFGVIGTGGVGAGLFIGPSFQGVTLSHTYQGCPSFREVIRLWAEHPTLEAEPRDVNLLETSIENDS